MKKNKGFISARLVICLFILFVFIAFIVQQIIPFKIYRDLKAYGRDIALKMEINGGVSSQDITDLKKSISSIGLDTSKLTINTETTMTGPNIKFGDEVIISYVYTYEYNEISIGSNVLLPKLVSKTLTMPVKFSSTSRKGR